VSEDFKLESVPEDFELLLGIEKEEEDGISNVALESDNTMLANFEREDYKIIPSVYQSMPDLPATSFSSQYSIESHLTANLKEIVHKFYTVPEHDFETVFDKGNLCTAFMSLDAKTFNKFSLMIRKPSLEAIHYLNQADLTKPPLKVLLHGRIGSGKTSCLMHMQHFLCSQDFLVIPITNLRNTMHSWQEVLFEADDEGVVDVNAKGQQPVKAAEWIRNLIGAKKTKEFLAELTTDQQYQWGVDEVSDEGTTLLSLCEFALNRPRRASRIASVVIDQVKRHANLGAVKVAVVVDEVQRLFHRTGIVDPRASSGSTTAKRRNRASSKKLQPQDLELVCAFKKLFEIDWKNGVVVASVRASEKRPIRNTPRSVLGINAFNQLTPFIPIEVPIYNNEEFVNQLTYYKELKWIQPENIATKEQVEQLAFLSNRHPARLYEICCLL